MFVVRWLILQAKIFKNSFKEQKTISLSYRYARAHIHVGVLASVSFPYLYV